MILEIICIVTMLCLIAALITIIKVHNMQHYYQQWHHHNQSQQQQWQHIDQALTTALNQQQQSLRELREFMQQQLNELAFKLHRELSEFKQTINDNYQVFREKFDEHQFNQLKKLTESLQKNTADIREQINLTLTRNADNSHKQMSALTQQIDKQLTTISGQVEKRLAEGFEKTTSTFSEILQRLSLIDKAQQKITELSSNVVGLQHILADKSARGAFGEVQLSHLIKNMLPDKHYALQHTFSNNKRADCVLLLPEPIGTIAIDAKFPLEDYQMMVAAETDATTKKAAATRFRQMVKKHIQDIMEKYIIPQETADGAMMFIPAEAVFAEIHSHFPDLVDMAHRKRVWLVSPTTMMAVLTTASAVLKDVETRKQVHLIQEHLQALSKDFGRFQLRMDTLEKHIAQANKDVQEVNTSARKISSRFNKIEQVELQQGQDMLDKTTKTAVETTGS